MIHVPDVRAAADWYESIGFRILEAHGDGGGTLSFAMLAFGDGHVMFSEGGVTSTARRREVERSFVACTTESFRRASHTCTSIAMRNSLKIQYLGES